MACPSMLYPIRNRSRITLCGARQFVEVVIEGEPECTVVLNACVAAPPG